MNDGTVHYNQWSKSCKSNSKSYSNGVKVTVKLL